MPTFHANEIRVFDRSGAPLGSLTGWSVEQPRSYRLNEVDDFAFSMPRQTEDGAVVISDFVHDTLLLEDNHIYLANYMYGMRGWGGVISSVTYGDDGVVVTCIGGLSLVHKLDTALIEQSEGFVWTIASRMVSAAQAKQAAHGDVVVNFVHDENPFLGSTARRNYGQFAYEGDILAGLQTLASERICEFFTHARIRRDGHITYDLRWAGRYQIDHEDIVIRDGVGGTLAPGTTITNTGQDLVNRVRLRGAPTQLGQYVHYDSVRGVVQDVTPECELALDDEADPKHRRREELGLTVGFGYSQDTERGLAEQIEQLYLGYFKSYCYAYHARLGKPFLEGYDWAGPDGNNDKRITAHYFRNYNRLGFIGKRTVIVGATDDDDATNIDATIDDWQFIDTITPVVSCVGAAVKWDEPDSRWLADSSNGNVYELDGDGITLTLWGNVCGTGETLRSVATDSTQATLIWVLVTNGTHAIVKTYNAQDQTLVSLWDIVQAGANDITVDSIQGIIWMVATSTGDVQARDMNSGVLITSGTPATFDSGMGSPVGLSMSGGLAYVIDAGGNVRFLYADDGNFAGSKATGITANGLFVDAAQGRLWVIRPSGSIDRYRAHIAVSSINPPGSVDGAPGFEAIVAGQFVHVVMNSDTAASPHPKTKLLMVYSPGRYVEQTVPGPFGEPDVLQRSWVTGEQVSGFIINRKSVGWAPAEAIIQGEESRVDDWNPQQDGYGFFGSAYYRTARGHTLRIRGGWFFRDWDVPDAAFQPDAPEWTEGLAYLQGYLAKQNKSRTIQVLNVTNKGGLFKKIVLGGRYTVQVSRQGPPGGLSGILRVLAYTPDEREGNMEIIGEWVG